MLFLLILIPLGTLATSAAAKLRGRAAFTGFATATATLGRLPRRLATPAAIAVLATETALAAALAGAVAAPGPLALPALTATTALFGAFTTVLAVARRAGTAGSCHCFGPSKEPVAARHVARAAALAGLAAAGTVAAAVAPRALDPAGQPPAVLFLNACTALAAVAVAAGLDTLAWLLRRPGTPPSPWRNP
ncbi:hypothetical protein Daura_23855 [Dactylosporangium aurantiacum]|uniref:Methylamine utilisation protein MauE domain-containing protein n=1 Tax=Dactylosporangium aurantiacum TaxID=35754 RepID=A0A9Q9MRX2_9ACTN|nr:MauE/DoxX family redox-associated membrane protein [Dactylosporangium aurantiacum]MDG6103874.1 hypothetical protein [Dactylosporangium aurantiacum]UWZ58932.1 hypothetical protein Daura_23855 [Dactylosporangium aurantiacum]